MPGIFPSNNPSERRPDAERVTAYFERKKIFGDAAEYAKTITSLRHKEALLEVVEPATVQVTTTVVGNVIALAALKVATELTEQAQSLSEQDQRLVAAREATNAAHQPDVDTLLQDIGYEPAA